MRTIEREGGQRGYHRHCEATKAVPLAAHSWLVVVGDDLVWSRPISGPRDIARHPRGQTLYFAPRDDPQSEMPRTSDLRRVGGPIVTLLPVLRGVLLVHVLSRTTTIQDCVMSGRTFQFRERRYAHSPSAFYRPSISQLASSEAD
jgi:hypothetical protein